MSRVLKVNKVGYVMAHNECKGSVQCKTDLPTNAEVDDVYNVLDEDGTYYYYNGSNWCSCSGDIESVNIASVEQETVSTADEGVNVLKITLDDGTESRFEVRNGSKGSTGEKGDKGDKGDPGEKGETGSGIASIEYIESNEDDGLNRLIITKDGGGVTAYPIKNGSKGSAGEKGDPGDCAWTWLGDFLGTNGISIANVKDTAKEFKVIGVIDGGSGADVALENYFINSSTMAQYVQLTSYYYSSTYHGCIAHQYDYTNSKINLYSGWTQLTGANISTTGILSRVFYR